VKVSRAQRRIHQQSFRLSTQPVDAAEYLQEHMSRSHDILLDFDHKEIRVEGRRATPPKLQGVSGGGIFQISRKAMRGPLVAIATENKQRSRLIVDTRIKHFLAIVRALKIVSALSATRTLARNGLLGLRERWISLQRCKEAHYPHTCVAHKAGICRVSIEGRLFGRQLTSEQLCRNHVVLTHAVINRLHRANQQLGDR